MFRDVVLKRLIYAKRDGRIINHEAQDHTIELIRTAKAVRLDQDSLALINSYANEIGDQGCRHILATTRISWPLLWFEHDEFDEDGNRDTYGALFNQTADTKSCICFAAQTPPDGKQVSSYRDIICSHRTLQVTPEFEHARAFDNHFKIENEVLSPRHGETGPILERVTLRLMERASVLSSLLVNSNLLTYQAERPVSKLKQKAFRKVGETPPAHRVQKIDLTDLGRKMHRLRVLDEDVEVEGETGTSGKRRAHWVRDHMFVARNGLLTYRKAHIRGLGKLQGGDAVVVAPQDHETPEP